MIKKSLFGLGSVALALTLTACNDEKQSETPKALGTQSAVVDEVPANAVFKAKVRNVIGETDMQKSADSDWKRLRQGQTVVEDNRIRTSVESEATLGVNDGSVLTVAENSEITVSAEMLSSLAKKVSVLVKNGNVYFDIQKQQDATFEFKTGTAVAAIRGTAGFVGSVGGQTVASLKEGRVEVTNAQGEATDLLENQTVLVNKEGKAQNLKLNASGTKALAKAIDSIATASGGADVDLANLQASLQQFDVDYSKRKAAFEDKIRFQGNRIPDSISVPTITLQARVTPGVIVSVWGETDTVSVNGIYQRTFSWDANAYGLKRFLVTCSDGFVESHCFTWQTLYGHAVAAPAPVVEVPAEEPAPVKEVKAPEEKKAATAPAKSVSVKVSVAGGRTERQHLDLPATELKTNLKFTLSGISTADLDEIKSIQVRQGGKVVGSIAQNDMTSLTYEVPVSIKRNHSTEFEVVVTNKAGKNFKAKKTYEVFCYLPNHPGGKARNTIGPKENEYDQVVQAGQLIKD